MNYCFEHLKTLFNLISYQKHSVNYQKLDSIEQGKYIQNVCSLMNYLQENYFISNKTINKIINLAESNNIYKTNFDSLFKIENVVYNYKINELKPITILC